MSEFPNPETQFKPGQSGNPAGKPKGAKNRATILREILSLPLVSIDALKKHADGLPEGVTIEQAINYALAREASKGDVAAIKEVNDTLYGKLTDKIQNEHTFTQMGRVKIGDNAIEFDVGADPAVVPGSKEPD